MEAGKVKEKQKKIKKFSANRSLNPAFFLSKREKVEIKNAIIQAENETSGEIRVQIAKKVQHDIMQEAKRVFEKIGMIETKERNGILIYFAVKDRKFAILGDKGIHEKMGDAAWNTIASAMQEYFKNNDFAGGLSFGIGRIGEALKTHFPHQKDDINELPDDISY